MGLELTTHWLRLAHSIGDESCSLVPAAVAAKPRWLKCPCIQSRVPGLALLASGLAISRLKTTRQENQEEEEQEEEEQEVEEGLQFFRFF